jgi:hypothetical protein
VNTPRDYLVALAAARVPEMLGEAGMSVRPRRGRRPAGAHLAYDLMVKGAARPLWLAVLPSIRASEVEDLAERTRIAAEVDAVFLAATVSLNSGVRAALREAGVSHADLDGSVFVTAPGIHVRMDAPGRTSAQPLAGHRADPFADRTSLVLRAMLREPQRVWGVREIALAAGVSPGLASRTADEIKRRGYAASRDGKLALHDAAAVLLDWAGASPWRKNKVRAFVAPYEGVELRRRAIDAAERFSPGSAALTQLAGLELYTEHVTGPAAVHVYCAPLHFDSACAGLQADLYAEPVRAGGNVHLVSPALQRSVFFDARQMHGMNVVSPVQLFLDLTAYPLRGAEGAEMLLRTVLGPELGLTSEQVQRAAAFVRSL